MTEGNIKSIQERIKQLGIQPAQFSPNLNKSTFEPKNVPLTQKTKPVPPPRGKSRLEVRTLPKPPTKFQKTNVTNTPTETQKTTGNINVERSSFKRSPTPTQTNKSFDVPNNERPNISPRPRQKQLPPPPPVRGNVRMTQSFVETPDSFRKKPNRAPPPIPSPSLRLSKVLRDSKEDTKIVGFVPFTPELDDMTDDGDTSTDTSDTKERGENESEQKLFTKKYAVPSSTQVKSAITMQKWVRRWLAKRQLKKLSKLFIS